MTLDSSGSLSFSELKSEYGVTGDSCSYSQLKRGGSFVDNSKNVEVTNAISAISNTYSAINPNSTLGYSNRYMYGNLHTYSSNLGAGGLWAYGFVYNDQALSSVFNSIPINNDQTAGANGTNYNREYILRHGGTSQNGQTVTETVTATMGRAGTYYVFGLSGDAGQLGIEVDTGSGFSTVYSLATQTSTQTLRYTFNASVGHKIRFTLKGNGEEIIRHYTLSTSSSGPDKTAAVLINQNVPTDATLSSSNGMSLSDFYDGENA